MDAAPLAVAILLSSLALAGCFGGPGADEEPEDEPARARSPVRPGSSNGPSAVLDYPNTSVKTFASVPSVGGHEVPITIYRPTYADAAQPVPVILHSHGWAGSRATADDAFPDYIAGGFGVVSIDMRGHGEARSTSQARVHHVDYEIKDVSAVIDHIADFDWVVLDAPGDPRLGAIGGSYGGGYQLLTAILDGRLDAIAPAITWNHLVQSLAPNGVLKSAWVDLLYHGGNAQARLHDDIHRGYTFAQATNRVPDGTLPGEPNLRAQLLNSSPASYPGALAIPTFLIQGANDTLFPVNEALSNYRAIQSTGAPVRLVTHFDGHLLNTEGTLSSVPSPEPVGLQPPRGPSPCGDITDLTIAWFQKHLQGRDVDTGPAVCFAIDGTTVAEAQRLPWFYVPAAPSPAMTLRSGVAGQRAEHVLLTAEHDTYIVGAPFLFGSASTSVDDAIFFWTLEVHPQGGDAYTANAQVTPQRLPTSVTDQAFILEMMAVSLHLAPGDRLVLVAESSHDQFAHTGGRTPAEVTVKDVTVNLPFV